MQRNDWGLGLLKNGEWGIKASFEPVLLNCVLHTYQYFCVSCIGNLSLLAEKENRKQTHKLLNRVILWMNAALSFLEKGQIKE